MTSTTAESTRFSTPCPDWCTLKPGHPIDAEHPGGRESRGHGGPSFGRFLYSGASEFTDAPGELVIDVSIAADDGTWLDRAELLKLSQDALDAAAWLEVHQ